jgi:prepilin-type N-terminal cleavage/methylation domain-containing protein
MNLIRTLGRRSGFTLIELLVVIAIIAILAAILFPVFAQAKLAAKKTAALSNIKQLGLATMGYLADNDDTYAEAVGGGCTNDASSNNRIWGASIQPYIKNKDIYTDPVAGTSGIPFRYNSSVAVPEFGLKANDTPCGTATIRGDLRSSTTGLNRQFFSYYICGQDTGQIGCSLSQWEPDPPTAGVCAPYFTNASRIQEPAGFVMFAPTTPDCGSGQTSYVVSAADPIDLKGGYASMSSRQGEGTSIGFADGHAKYFKAQKDAQIAALTGNPNQVFSPLQNRHAVKLRAQGGLTSDNGTLNCVNHNSAKVQWSAFVDMPGQNPALDALCNN